MRLITRWIHPDAVRDKDGWWGDPKWFTFLENLEDFICFSITAVALITIALVAFKAVIK